MWALSQSLVVVAVTPVVSAAATSPPGDVIDTREGVPRLDEPGFRRELGSGVKTETLDASAGVG